MATEQGQRVLGVLEAFGPELPIAVVSRHSGIRPTLLAPILDELHDDGLIEVGRERQSVALVARPGEGSRGRAMSSVDPTTRAPAR